MAGSSLIAAAAPCLSPRFPPSCRLKTANVSLFPNSCTLKQHFKLSYLVFVENPSNISPVVTNIEADAPSSSIEPSEAFSLISALNAEKALYGLPITDMDYYGVLNLSPDCSEQEVVAAYKSKVYEVGNSGLEDDRLSKELAILKESFAILSTTEERRMYDWSLARSQRPERYTWPFQSDKTDVSCKGIPPPQEPEDDNPTTLVGLGLLAWFILSVVLSFVLYN